jgi:hypothetical protein
MLFYILEKQGVKTSCFHILKIGLLARLLHMIMYNTFLKEQTMPWPLDLLLTLRGKWRSGVSTEPMRLCKCDEEHSGCENTVTQSRARGRPDVTCMHHSNSETAHVWCNRQMKKGLSSSVEKHSCDVTRRVQGHGESQHIRHVSQPAWRHTLEFSCASAHARITQYRVL